MRILVTGGAGYIGSITVKMLLEQGHVVTVVDDLSHGHRGNVDPAILHTIRLQDREQLVALMKSSGCEAIVHFASFIEVGESMKKPWKYYENNVGGAVSLLGAAVECGIGKFVFSSTAAVYGIPKTMPITEDQPLEPVNVYGESKLFIEKMLRRFDDAHGLRSVTLRYFNASGAHPSGLLGEAHDPESHLLPLVFRAVRTGNPVTLFGNDYPTPDGTCIRDYIHVCDLAKAHILALRYLDDGGKSERFNVGTGKGHSVLELLNAVEVITGQRVPHTFGPRRAGDPPELVACSDKLRTTLGWAPEYADLSEIVRTAWNYEQKKTAASV